MQRVLITCLAAALAVGCGQGRAAPPADFEALARASLSQIDGELRLEGLTAAVEVLRDRWGVPHIYASNLDDLFFAQGFVVAQDRLWQMEMSRRISQGRLAEIVGPPAVPHDRLVRMLQFRGPFDEREWTNYHPEARRIFTAYAHGVNAFIAQARERLPVEFVLTGLTPEPWRPEEILHRARVSAAIASARRELRLAQDVARFGAAAANRRARPDPYGELRVPEGLDVTIVTDEVIRALDGDLYGDLPAVPLIAPYADWAGATRTTDAGAPELSPGSNNWAVAPALSANGRAILVDDPHRAVTLPRVAVSDPPARARLACRRRDRAGPARRHSRP